MEHTPPGAGDKARIAGPAFSPDCPVPNTPVPQPHDRRESAPVSDPCKVPA